MNWIADLRRITQDYHEAFGELSEEQLNWKPAPEVWSVGQVIDHVMVTNSTYLPILAALRAGTYQPHFNARFGFLASLFGKMILRSVQPESKRKQKTFPPFEPSRSAIPGDIVARFETHQARLAQEIENTHGLLDRVVSSPANRAIVLRLTRVFDILVAHERRHLAQAKAVLDALSLTSPLLHSRGSL